MINFTKILTITISLSTIPTALGSQEVVSSRIGENIDDLQNATARSRYLKGGVRGSAVGSNGSVGSTGRGSSRGRAYSNYSSSQNNSTNKYGPTSGSSSSGGAVAIGMAILAVVALIAVVTTCSQVSQASETGKGTAVACSSQYKSTTGSLVEENRSTMESFQVKLSEETTYLYTASYIESGKKCTSSAELHFCPSVYGADGTCCIEWSIRGKGLIHTGVSQSQKDAFRPTVMPFGQRLVTIARDGL